MIKIKDLAKSIEDKLNAVAIGGIQFEIHTDTGEYKKAIRKINAVTQTINGIYSVTQSDVENTNSGLTVATMTGRIEFVIPCKDDEEDIYETVLNLDTGTKQKTLITNGNVTFFSIIRETIDKICEKNYFETMTDGTTEYDTTSVFSLAVSGQRTQLPKVGDCFSYVIYGYYNIVAGGENSRKWTLYLDGEQVPYLSATIRRIPTSETNVFLGDMSTKNLNNAETFGVSVECPSIIGKFNKTLKGYLLNGEKNKIHTLRISTGEGTADFMERTLPVNIGEASATASGVLNVGQSFSFAEATIVYGLTELTGVKYQGNATSQIELKYSDIEKPYTYEGDMTVIEANFNSRVGGQAYTIKKGESIFLTPSNTKVYAFLYPLTPAGIAKGFKVI